MRCNSARKPPRPVAPRKSHPPSAKSGRRWTGSPRRSTARLRTPCPAKTSAKMGRCSAGAA
eukprot:10224738-Alexandrium_andersonii.AAC.1